jgi:hypothetical protein
MGSLPVVTVVPRCLYSLGSFLRLVLASSQNSIHPEDHSILYTTNYTNCKPAVYQHPYTSSASNINQHPPTSSFASYPASIQHAFDHPIYHNGLSVVLLRMQLRPSQLGPLRRLYQLRFPPLRALRRRESLRPPEQPQPHPLPRDLTIPVRGTIQHSSSTI